MAIAAGLVLVVLVAMAAVVCGRRILMHPPEEW